MTDKDNIRLMPVKVDGASAIEAEEDEIAEKFAAFLARLISKGVPEEAATSTAMYRYYSTRRK